MPTRSMKFRQRSIAKGLKIKREFQSHGDVADERKAEKASGSRDESSDAPAHKKFKLDGTDELVRKMLQTTREMEGRHRHHHFPALNVCASPLRDFDELRDYPSIALSPPQPVYVARKRCERVDICHRRTMAREYYRKRILSSRTRYQTARKNNRKLRSMEKNNVYHMSVFELAERLQHNPDPFFHGSYDYYYTGGNLCVLPEEGGYVLHSDGDNLLSLNVGQVKLHDDCKNISLEPVASHIFPPESEIFEVRALRSPRENRHYCFGVRQRNNITLHSLQPEEQRTKPLTQFKSSSTPLISFAQSTSELNIMLVSSMNQLVRCYDLNSSTPKLQQLYNLNSDTSAELISWNTVKPWREHTFLFADEKKLCCMDLRTSPKQWLQSSCGFSDAEFGCELISSLAVSQFDHLLYVGTSHKLHCLDMRFLRRHFEADGAVCRWTHQLEYAPAFIETFRQRDSEFIAMSSALAGDLRLCELTNQFTVKETDLGRLTPVERATYKAFCLPYQPSTLQEAYESARLAGTCLNPEADLSQRILCCTTGLAVSTQSSAPAVGAALLVSNSNGDVFAQRINARETQEYEPRTNVFSNEMMTQYAELACRNTPHDLQYTDVADMALMRKVFRCEALNAAEKLELESAEEQGNASTAILPRRRCLGRWQKPMQTLYSYKDALVPDLLSIWDIEYEEEKDIRLKQLSESQRIKPDPETIVSSWLNAATTKHPMSTVPAHNLSDNHFDVFEANEPLEEDFYALPQSTQIVDETVVHIESSALELQQTLNNTTITARVKTKATKKKSKYVKGF